MIMDIVDVGNFNHTSSKPQLTLRQWYAGQALASGLCPHVYEFDAVAGWCKRMADALIKAEAKDA